MKKRFSGPQIVAKLRQADVLIGQGKSVPELGRGVIYSGERLAAAAESRTPGIPANPIIYV